MSGNQEWSLHVILTFVATLMLGTVFNQSFQGLGEWHMYSWIFHVGMLIFCFSFSIYLLFVSKKPELKTNWSTLVALIMILPPAVWLRVSYVNSLSIWLDEYVQIANRSSPFVESAIQQQPPFMYQLGTLLLDWFGNTEFWLRFPSLFFGSAILVVAALFGRILKFRLEVMVLWLLALAFTPALVRYSFEARPNIAGVFACLVWMCCLAVAMIKQHRGHKDFLRIFLSTYFFCSIIGMQSLALPLYSIPLIVIFFLISKKFSWGRLAVLSQAFALFAFIPVLTGIVIESAVRNQFQNPGSWQERMLNFSEMSWVIDGLSIFNMIPYFRVFIFLTTIYILALWWKRRHKEFNFLNHFIFFATMALPFVYTWIFQITINWNFFERYFLCYVVLFLSHHFFYMDRALKFFKIKDFEGGRRRLFVLMIAPVVAFSMGAYAKFYLHIDEMFNYHSDIRAIYRQINENNQGNHLLATFTVKMEPDWEPCELIAPEFYLKKRDDLFYRTYDKKPIDKGDQVRHIVKTLFKNDVQQMTLIMGPFTLFENQSFYSTSGQKEAQVLKFPGYEVLQIKGKSSEDIADIFKKYIRSWRESKFEDAHSLKLAEALYYLALYSGNWKEAQSYYQRILEVYSEKNSLIQAKIQLMETSWKEEFPNKLLIK